MDNATSAELARIIRASRETARRYRLRRANVVCLLSNLLEEENITDGLRRIGVKVDNLREAAREWLRNGTAAHETDTLPDTDVQNAADGAVGTVCAEPEPEPDADLTRVTRLSELEMRMANKAVDGSGALMLGLLHDRNNPGKALLAEYGIDYKRVAALLIPGRGKQPAAGYSYADEDASPYPGDERDGAGHAGAEEKSTPPPQGKGDTPVTDNFGTDLTAVAAKGGLDPVVGREREILRLVQILCRRKKNNPVLIGEPGVGKSAVVEGLAQLIAQHKVPRPLAGKRIVSLDLAAMVAGTQYRGQFEERVRRLMQELRDHPEIILFIDEIHTIIGAGSAAGTLDAANMLKPALARGEVQCIGATTTGEYRKSIEKDGALERRFQKILLEPTTAEETLAILRNAKSRYEEHHNVTYTDSALKACVDLTTRYVTSRALPDKAIDALDEAGSRKRLLSAGVPPELAAKEKEIADTRALKMEAARAQDYERAADLRDRAQQMEEELRRLTREWEERQKEHPAVVDEADVAEVVSMMSGVPASKVAEGEKERLGGMRDALNARVIAQTTAVDRLTRAIQRSRVGLKGTDRPIGTFLFVGPTGVGKTHLVKCLAEWMFGSRDALIRVDMSEYGEKYSVSRLVGAPPGYVGYEEGGQLTERVRRHPYSVVLLDEIEKAHQDVFNTLLQVMDEGRLTDGNGVTVDFRNTVIILTSNSGTRQLREYGGGIGFGRAESAPTGAAAEGIVMKTLRRQFAPEFLNRLDDIIFFNPLDKESAGRIAALELSALRTRMAKAGYEVEVTPAAEAVVVEKGFDAQYGARSLKRAIQRHIEDPLCDAIMANPAAVRFTADTKDGKVTVTAGKAEAAAPDTNPDTTTD